MARNLENITKEPEKLNKNSKLTHWDKHCPIYGAVIYSSPGLIILGMVLYDCIKSYNSPEFNSIHHGEAACGAVILAGVLGMAGALMAALMNKNYF